MLAHTYTHHSRQRFIIFESSWISSIYFVRIYYVYTSFSTHLSRNIYVIQEFAFLFPRPPPPHFVAAVLFSLKCHLLGTITTSDDFRLYNYILEYVLKYIIVSELNVLVVMCVCRTFHLTRKKKNYLSWRITSEIERETTCISTIKSYGWSRRH